MSTSQNPNVGRRSNGDRAPGSGSGSSGGTAYRSGRLGRAPLHQGWQPAGRACIVALVRGGVAWQGGRCIGEGRCVREGRGGASGRVAAAHAGGESARGGRHVGEGRGGEGHVGLGAYRGGGRRTAQQ